jgi:hypothetical protein
LFAALTSTTPLTAGRGDRYVLMAMDAAATHWNRPPMELQELIAFTRRELDADAERQAQVAADGGALESQTGATLDLSHKNIHALPVEVIALIKDKVERYGGNACELHAVELF